LAPAARQPANRLTRWLRQFARPPTRQAACCRRAGPRAHQPTGQPVGLLACCKVQVAQMSENTPLKRQAVLANEQHACAWFSPCGPHTTRGKAGCHCGGVPLYHMNSYGSASW